MYRSQCLLGERIHHVVDVSHGDADFLHQRASGSNVRPGIHGGAWRTNRQVAVLQHIGCEVNFQIGNDARRHRLQDFLKLIQFEGFLNVRPFRCYGEVVLDGTSGLACNDVRLRGSGNITTTRADRVVVVRTLEVHT